MTLRFESFLLRHRPVHELSREGSGGPSIEERRREAGIVDRNTLSPGEARALVLAIRGTALRMDLPDSTASIRADRDGR